MADHPSTIYKIVHKDEWIHALQEGKFSGSPIDAQDGFIHFSTAQQVKETAVRYFANQPDLLLVAVDTSTCGEGLRWEASRGGEMFPHLYNTVILPDKVLWSKELTLCDDGSHLFPELA